MKQPAKGEGVPRNDAKAVRWYHRAAEQGHASAQNNLGLMYEYGHGVSRDFVRAYQWYKLAASRTRSDFDRRAYGRNRDRVATWLTPVELAKAQRLAREWRPRSLTVQPPEQGRRPSASEVPTSSARPVWAEGDHIANLQRALLWLGYDPGPVDGTFGLRTRAAIRAFQAAGGLLFRLPHRFNREAAAARCWTPPATWSE